MFSTADDDNDVSLSEITTKPKLKDLVKFVCEHPYLPNNGLSLRVVFTRSTLSDAESCFNLIKLPLPNTTYEEFKKAMHVAINCQHQHQRYSIFYTTHYVNR